MLIEDMRSPEILIAGSAGTGKTLTCLEKVYRLATTYPNARILILRKVRADLSETALVTWEDDVLGQDHPLVVNGPRRDYRRNYHFPNGSDVIVGGLDRPTKIMSGQYDLIYCNEAIELPLEGYEALTTRARNGKIWGGENELLGQIICDANPAYPDHHLKLRADEGKMRYLQPSHKDNPLYYDHDKKKYTLKGKAYIAMLDKLTGVRKARLRYGRWVRAEGVVLEEYDAQIHKLSRKEMVARGLLKHTEGKWPLLNNSNIKAKFCSADWGFRNPGVFKAYIVDKDDNVYCILEIYQTERKIGWWKAKAKKLRDRLGMRVFVCDPSQPGNIAELNGLRGIRAIKAYNDIEHGIQTFKEYLAPEDGGDPQFYYVEDNLEAIDFRLKEAKRPFKTEQEIDSYVWADTKNKERPVDENNHGIDADRYGLTYHAGFTKDKPKKARAWGR